MEQKKKMKVTEHDKDSSFTMSAERTYMKDYNGQPHSTQVHKQLSGSESIREDFSVPRRSTKSSETIEACTSRHSKTFSSGCEVDAEQDGGAAHYRVCTDHSMCIYV